MTNRKRVLRVAIATAGMAMLSLWLAAAPRVPRRINDVKPIYPPESLKRGDEGAMLFELSVDASGTVQDARTLWSGCERLEKAALAAVRQWRYGPWLVNGTPVPFKVVARVPFRLPAPFKSRAGRSGACKWKEPPTPVH